MVIRLAFCRELINQEFLFLVLYDQHCAAAHLPEEWTRAGERDDDWASSEFLNSPKVSREKMQKQTISRSFIA